MKITLTEEQKTKMNQIFNLMNELSEDKNFQKALKSDEDDFSNEDDYLNCINFIENIIDTAKCNFNYWGIE